MKMKIVFLMLTCLVSISNANSQGNSVMDTLQYLKTIEANKASYIGQPFSVLQSSLQLGVKFYFPTAPIPHRMNQETSTAFSFYYPATAEDVNLTYPHLEIYWRFPLDAGQSFNLRNQFRSVGWNQIIYNHYANAVVADIKVLE